MSTDDRPSWPIGVLAALMAVATAACFIVPIVRSEPTAWWFALIGMVSGGVTWFWFSAWRRAR